MEPISLPVPVELFAILFYGSIAGLIVTFAFLILMFLSEVRSRNLW